MDNGRDHTRPSTFRTRYPWTRCGRRSTRWRQGATWWRSAPPGKPFTIAAVGAELSGVPQLNARAEALEIGISGHEQFRRFGELAVPSFAFINGAAMGGGLEIALHCTYRSVSSGAAAISLPECFLGLVPGWGGTYLLPNLVGADTAVTVIVENALNQNKQLKPAQGVPTRYRRRHVRAGRLPGVLARLGCPDRQGRRRSRAPGGSR